MASGSNCSPKFGKPWFTRDSMAPELSGIATADGVLSTARKVLFKNGEDLRLKQPGFNWSILTERRHKLTDNFRTELTGIFDKYYSKIINTRCAREGSEVSAAPILPSAKTPARSTRNKARVSPIPEDSSINHSPPRLRRTRACKEQVTTNKEVISHECVPVARSSGRSPTVISPTLPPPSPVVSPSPSHEDSERVELSLAKPTPPRKALKLKLRRKGGKKANTRAAELRVEAEVVTSPHPVPQSVTSSPTVEVPNTSPTLHTVNIGAEPGSSPTLHTGPEPGSSPTLHTVNIGAEPGSSPTLHTVNKPADNIPSPPTVNEELPVPGVTPSYLAPKTLLQLRDEYQSRSGGKVVSMSDLRTSKGCSPVSKHTKVPWKPLRVLSSGMRRVSVNLTPCLGKRTVHVEDNFSSEGKRRKRTLSNESCQESTENDDSQSTNGIRTDGTGTEDTPGSSDSGVDILPQSSYTFLRGGPKLVMGVVNKEVPLSFLPQKQTPKKPDTTEIKKAQLADKLLRKNEEGMKRQENLKNIRQQEIEKRKRKREERERRVAEKQAALRQEEEQKKQRIKGQQNQDQTKKVTIKKAKEVEEKNKKLKKRMMAAEARRRQEQEQQKKRLQQLEEERKMVLDLAMQRREMEEEERRLKREKAKQDREKRIEEHREQQEEIKRKRDEEILKQQLTEAKTRTADNPPAKHSDVKKYFEKLLGGAGYKVPVVATPKLTHILSNSGNKSSSEKTRMLQAYYNGKHAPPSVPPTTALSPADSRLNATFVKDTPSVSKAPPLTYQMTPPDNDPLYKCDNYGIDDLSASDSTDDDEDPKKTLPLWALPDSLNMMMKNQEEDLKCNRVNIAEIFPPEQLLRDPDLARIFRNKRQRFYQRSSSAQWNSPMIKKSRIV